MIAELTENDLDEIARFEERAFPEGLQAHPETVRERFRLGHLMLAERRSGLQGAIGFSYGRFDPADPSTIPASFRDWSRQTVPADYDTVFIYSLGLSPEIRGTETVATLVDAALARARADGCRKILAEGPVPSYAGTDRIRPNPAIRAALDAFAAGGPPPPEELLFRDPHLALYRSLCPCTIVRVMPDFLPADRASGGFRAMLFREV